MKTDNKERHVEYSTLIDLTDEAAEQTHTNSLQQKSMCGTQSSASTHNGRRRNLFGPVRKCVPPTSLGRFSTISTIRLFPSSLKKSKSRPCQESNEFIDITKYASKLSGNTRFHCVDGTQFTLSNKQVIWDSKTSPLQVRCVKCVKNFVTRAVFPCGHLCLCGDCGYKVFSAKKTCPVCNKTISNLAVYSWLG